MHALRAAFSAALLLLPALVAAADGVLILYSNQRPTPAQVIIEDTLRSVVADKLKGTVQIFSEYLDDEWSSLETYAAKHAEFLRDKYERRNIRVIVASAIPALQFATQFRDRIAAGVPVVYLIVARDRVDAAALPPGFVGNFEDNDPTPTLGLALRLHPQATRLVFVRGATERDRLWDQRVRAAVDKLGNGIEIDYVAGLPTADVVRRVAALPPGTVVFTPGFFVDGAGAVSTPRQSTELIAAASAAPVYGAFDTVLGAGIVGGYMTRYEDQAKEAGGIVVRLLEGVAPAQIAPASVARVPMVDWRQVRRWGIDERLLPAETIVRFREPTVWDNHWPETSAGIVVLVLQAGLISALLIQRRSRRRTERALEESQKQMSLAARAARLWVWSWDTARDKFHVTTRSGQPAAERPFAFADVVRSAHAADREELERSVNKALASGEEIDVEYRMMGPNSSERWIAVRGRAEHANSPHVLGVAIDVTERKHAELRAVEDRNALRHMTRVSMLGQLSASIAHQLNQPLAAILGNAETARKMLNKERVDLAELREICDDIVSEDNRAAEVIRRLGALYKRGDMKMEQLDFNALVRETLELLRAELLIRHVLPITDLAASLPMIDGGSVQLQQVILNLVLNAADAMTTTRIEDRRLTLRTEATEAGVRLAVIDNGTGIAPNALPKVFDAFWSTKAGGMGIGLAICQSIVAAHHGRIMATNNPDGGATFCVNLPVKHPT
jgi:C4-dicarboxylate-specific signal transduction histidine kinase